MSKPPDVQRTTEPHDRLTRIAAATTDAFDAHDEHDAGDRCIVFLSSEKEQRHGLVIHGYDNDTAAIVDLFMHLRAMFRAQGKELHLVPVGTTPEGERS